MDILDVIAQKFNLPIDAPKQVEAETPAKGKREKVKGLSPRLVASAPPAEKLPKERPKSLPYFGLTSYQVYLILPENITEHSQMKRFQTTAEGKTHNWIWMKKNGRIYHESEIEGIYKPNSFEFGNDGALKLVSCNFVFMDAHGNLAIGDCDFADTAKKIISSVERSKLKDRMYERTHYGLKAKYGNKSLMELLVLIIVVAVAVGLLFYFMFQGLPNALNPIASVVQGAHYRAAIPLNETITTAMNQTITHT